MSSINNCHICEKKTTNRCGKCKAVLYCSRSCQETDFAKHKSFCKKIASCRKKLEKEENIVRNKGRAEGGSLPFDPGNIGLFFFIPGTTELIKAKSCYFISLGDYADQLESKTALELAEFEAFDSLRLCRRDFSGMRFNIPGLLLQHEDRLQDCYDFMKWWITIGDNNGIYDFMDISLPYLDLKNQNMLERLPKEIFSENTGLSFIIAMLMLKLRLSKSFSDAEISFKAFLQGTIDDNSLISRLNGNHLVLHHICEYSCYVPKQGKIKKPYYKQSMRLLKEQIEVLYHYAKARNKIIWKALFNPIPLLEQEIPLSFSRGSIEEAYIITKQCFFAMRYTMNKTEGVRKLIMDLVGNDLRYDATMSAPTMGDAMMGNITAIP